MRGLPFIILLLCLTFSRSFGEKTSSFRGLASGWMVIPSRSLAGPHYLFKGYERDEEHGVVKVSGPVVEITNGDELGPKVHKEGFTSEMALDDFEEEQNLGLSVFEAMTRLGTNVGTAFLVGNDLVFTNRHVLNYAPSETKWECGKFSIKLNHREEKVDCQRVRFCSPKYDYCVVEMKKMASGKSLGEEIKPLKLTNKVRANNDTPLLHIGNAAGMGIQASRGLGLKISHGEFYHYVPTLGGSSGAPIFNEKGEVIGLNWGHTGGYYTDGSAFNHGVLMQTIFDELSKTHTRTRSDIKSFRFWLRRLNGHRKVQISDP